MYFGLAHISVSPLHDVQLDKIGCILIWEHGLVPANHLFHNKVTLYHNLVAVSDCSHEMKRTLAPWKKICDKPRQHIKKQRYHFADKRLCSQSFGFSSSPVQM